MADAGLYRVTIANKFGKDSAGIELVVHSRFVGVYEQKLTLNDAVAALFLTLQMPLVVVFIITYCSLFLRTCTGSP